MELHFNTAGTCIYVPKLPRYTTTLQLGSNTVSKIGDLSSAWRYLLSHRYLSGTYLA